MASTVKIDSKAIADALLSAQKETETDKPVEVSFSAEELGAAIGAAIGAMQSQQAETAEGHNIAPTSDQPAAENATGTDGNIINLSSLRERLTTQGDKENG